MSQWYFLDGHEPRPAASFEEYLEKAGAGVHVGDTTVGDVRVSTVFLGLDHCHGYGPPQLFETMIFGGEHDSWQERCSTWDQAEALHERALSLVRKTIQ